MNNAVNKVNFIYNGMHPFHFVHCGKVHIENGVAYCKDVWVSNNIQYTRLPDMIVSAVNILVEQEEPSWWKQRHGDEDSYGNR